jgi:hypothetical protein
MAWSHRECPACGGTYVARSRPRLFDGIVRALSFGMRAYRCTECFHRFWRFPSRKRVTRAFAQSRPSGAFEQSAPSSVELSLAPPEA